MNQVIKLFSLKKLVLLVVLPVSLFVFSYSGGLQAVAKTGTLFFKYYTDAELKKLEASGFINIEGNAEYVVALQSGSQIQDSETQSGEQFLLSQEGVIAARETDFDDWYVVEMAVSRKGLVDAIRKLPEIRFVLANRGVWICH